MIKNISILFVVSFLLSDGKLEQSCQQNELDLISLSEPYYLLKEDKCYSSQFTESRPIIDGNLDEDLWGDFDLLIGAYKNNLKITEVPVTYYERKEEGTKMTSLISNTLRMLFSVIAFDVPNSLSMVSVNTSLYVLFNVKRNVINSA